MNNMGYMGNMQGFNPAMFQGQNLEGMQNMQGMPNMQDMQGMQNMQGMPNMQGMQNMPNMGQNMQGMQMPNQEENQEEDN